MHKTYEVTECQLRRFFRGTKKKALKSIYIKHLVIASSRMDSVENTKKQLERCEARLASLTELLLPTDYARPIPQRIVEAEYALNISDQTSLAVLQLALAGNSAGAECTPFSIILAAFAILLQKYTGEEDITVGSSSATANPLILRMKISPELCIGDILKNVLNVNHNLCRLKRTH